MEQALCCELAERAGSGTRRFTEVTRVWGPLFGRSAAWFFVVAPQHVISALISTDASGPSRAFLPPRKEENGLRDRVGAVLSRRCCLSTSNQQCRRIGVGLLAMSARFLRIWCGHVCFPHSAEEDLKGVLGQFLAGESKHSSEGSSEDCPSIGVTPLHTRS